MRPRAQIARGDPTPSDWLTGVKSLGQITGATVRKIVTLFPEFST